MLELIHSIHVFAGIFILAVLAVLLICDPLGLRWPKTPRRQQHAYLYLRKNQS